MSGWLLMGGPASDSSMGVLVVGLVTVLVDRRIDESFFPRGFPELSSSSEWPAGGTLFEAASSFRFRGEQGVCGTQSLP